jgi:proton-translocating NADH-quinone oxidoreductase chain L
MQKMLFNLIIFLPLLSFCGIALFGRKFGVYGSIIFSCINILISLIFSIIIFFKISFQYIFYTEVWQWLSLSGFNIFFSLRYDSLTSIMFLVVTFVSACVHIYSSVYMYADPFLSRFMSYLSLFTFFMLLLVSSANFLVLFLGWEGVGLCSYLLIGFWYTRAQAGKAATKAFLINKIGDLFLLSGISLIAANFHTLEFATLNVLIPFYPNSLIEIISVFLFIGAVGKSAQIGLHTWLPDAMEGPTPVSALIHAATMVTAGVFLIIRSSFLFEYAPRFLLIIAVWGGITALISGTIGSVQNDIKKIIAYSTCSQLGYMTLVCGLSNYNLSLFHLFNHAFFKALLFLSAGSIIHLLNNEQDIRKIGGLAKLSPFIYINMLIASLALAGFPFLSGFYSKDLIIETSITKIWVGNQFIFWLALTSALLTAVYSFRLLEQVFWNNFNGFKIIILKHIKMTKIEIIILTSLALLSLFSGYLFKDIFSGLGSNYFNSFVIILPSNWNFIELEFLPKEIKILPLFLTCLAVELDNRIFECKWYYNEIINGYVSLPTLFLSKHFFEQYEKRLLEYNGPLFFQYLYNNLQYGFFKFSKNNISLSK